MALNAYLTLEGEKHGKVEGSCDQTGREGLMEIYGFNHEVVSPRDAASGLPTGKRQHKPFTVTKAVDKSSPLLMAILVNNENIKSWKMISFQPGATGDEVHYFTIELTNANIAGIRMEQLNNKYPENMNHEFREHVSFTYQKIAWTHELATVTADDDWKAPRQG